MKGKKKEKSGEEKVEVKEVRVEDLDTPESPKGGLQQKFQLATQMMRMKHDMGGPVSDRGANQD